LNPLTARSPLTPATPDRSAALGLAGQRVLRFVALSIVLGAVA